MLDKNCRCKINDAIRLLVDNGYTVTRHDANGHGEIAKPVGTTIHYTGGVNAKATARLHAEMQRF